MSRQSAHLLGVLISLVWGAFWIYFIVASTLSEPGSIPLKAAVLFRAIGIVLIGVIPPLFNPRLGGAVLLVEGIALGVANVVYFHNPPVTRAFLFLFMVLPPIMAGSLYLFSSTSSERYDGSPPMS